MEMSSSLFDVTEPITEVIAFESVIRNELSCTLNKHLCAGALVSESTELWLIFRACNLAVTSF